MKQITSEDIAKMAGVSRSTVSRVVNNYPNVPEATRQRVMALVEKYHYYPQYSGQLLSGRRSKAIGLFIISKTLPNILSQNSLLPIFAAASKRGYPLLCFQVSDSENEAELEQICRFFMEGRIDGGIFLGFSSEVLHLPQLRTTDKPIAMCNADIADRCGHRLLGACLDTSAAGQAVDYLFSKGHRRIALLDSDPSRCLCLWRHEAVSEAIKQLGLTPVRQAWGGLRLESCTNAALSLLENCRAEGITAVCADNDTATQAVYLACKQLGLRIPEDISVVNCEGLNPVPFSTPPTARLHYDLQAMLQALTDRLLDTIEGKPPASPFLSVSPVWEENASVCSR